MRFWNQIQTLRVKNKTNLNIIKKQTRDSKIRSLEKDVRIKDEEHRNSLKTC